MYSYLLTEPFVVTLGNSSSSSKAGIAMGQYKVIFKVHVGLAELLAAVKNFQSGLL